MRVAVAGLHHETNTFSPLAADLNAFHEAGLLRGPDIISEFARSHHTIAGFLRACSGDGIDVDPLLYAKLNPCGIITDEAFEYLVGELMRALRDRGPFDVVLLSNHGAAASETHTDATGELASRVRSLVGPAAVVGMTLDLHANVTDRAVNAVDVCVGYRENPHRDALDRGTECARLALGCARNDVQPVQSFVRLPMVVPILGGWTDVPPMSEVMADAAQIAARHSLISHTVFHGFGYADVSAMGSGVLTVSDGHPGRARTAAREIARRLWQRRERMRGGAVKPTAAISALQRRSGHGPTVLLDVGDNVGGGSPGDSTVLLSEAVTAGVPGVVVPLCDARAVEKARAAGEGAEIVLRLGATTSASVGPVLVAAGRVARITDGRFEDPNSTHGGFRFHDGGPTVRFSSADDHELIISSRAVPSWTPEQLRAVCLEPEHQRAIVAKGVVAPRAGYERVAEEFVLVDTPGVTAADLSRFTYRRRPAPLWPFEPDARFNAGEGIDRVAV